MNITQSLAYCALVFPAFASMSKLEAATTVFADNFSTSTINSNGNPGYGGNYGTQIPSLKWAGSSDAAISSQALTVVTSNAIRSAGIIIPASSFNSVAGNYTLSFDVTNWNPGTNPNSNGVVRIWSGSNFDTVGGGPKTLILDTYSASLTPQNGATSSMLASTTFQSTGNKTVTFDYSGSGVVALFFGVNTPGWPFPSVTYDNVSLSQTPAVVPEPSVMAFAAVLASASCFMRRRKN